MDGLRDAAIGARRHLLSRSSAASRSTSPARPAPRDDRAGGPVLVRGDRPLRRPRGTSSSTTVERGGFGADTAAPPPARSSASYFDIDSKKIEDVGDRARRADRRRCSDGPLTPDDRTMRQTADIRRAQRQVGLLERTGFLRIDPLTRPSPAIGLIACSVVVARRLDPEPERGDPYFFAIRQSIYAVVGIALMFALARDRLLALPRAPGRDLHGDARLDRSSSSSVGAAARGSTRAGSSSPSSPFSRPSWASSCSSSRWPASRSTGPGARRRWQRTARLLLLGIVPAAIVFVQPDLGTALVYGVVTLAILFLAGIRWTHFAALGGLALAAVAVVLVIAPAVGTSRPPGLPARATDVVPQSERRPEPIQLIRPISR